MVRYSTSDFDASKINAVSEAAGASALKAIASIPNFNIDPIGPIDFGPIGPSQTAVATQETADTVNKLLAVMVEQREEIRVLAAAALAEDKKSTRLVNLTSFLVGLTVALTVITVAGILVAVFA